MPTTIGHSLAGVFLNETRLFTPAKSKVICVFISLMLANLADLDFIPGILLGNPNRFHHGITHSFGAALLVGFLFATYFYFRQNQFGAAFGFATLVYTSHVVLDYLTLDTSNPVGVPVLWPISSKYFVASIAIFSDVHKDSSTATFLQSIFVPHNGVTILREIVILGPLTLAMIFWRKFFIK
ncbi:MAG: metal-dependent hydrolase [bacterium]